MKGEERICQERLGRHHDELRWLYMELYDNDSMFAELCDRMREFYLERNKVLRRATGNGRRIRTGISRMICWG